MNEGENQEGCYDSNLWMLSFSCFEKMLLYNSNVLVRKISCTSSMLSKRLQYFFIFVSLFRTKNAPAISGNSKNNSFPLNPSITTTTKKQLKNKATNHQKFPYIFKTANYSTLSQLSNEKKKVKKKSYSHNDEQIKDSHHFNVSLN